MIEIVLETEHYIIINKPSGIPVHPTLDKKRKNVHDELVKQTKNNNLILVHRLDEQTTGLLLFAKTNEANKILQKYFQDRSIEKIYWAVVHGKPKNESMLLKHYLKKIKKNSKLLNLPVKSGGDLALTEYKVIKSFDDHSLLECKIKTGRMHQIRSQLSAIGHSIVGDTLYGQDQEDSLKLHARYLSFLDPFTQQNIMVTAEVPADFYQFKKQFSYIKFYKPFNVLSQFTKENDEKTLADFNLPKDLYPAGRLDKDSEGLLLLTNDGPLIHRLLDPKFDHTKTYHVQVEGIPQEKDLDRLRKGKIKIQDYFTKPALVKIIDTPNFPPRDPPIRFRINKPTSWLEITISEGKNRQVRKMTAAVGFPTLRLVRVNIGKVSLEGLTPGEYKEISLSEILI